MSMLWSAAQVKNMFSTSVCVWKGISVLRMRNLCFMIPKVHSGCMYEYARVCVLLLSVTMYVCVIIYVPVFSCVCTCACVCVRACVCVCACLRRVQSKIHPGQRETERQTWTPWQHIHSCVFAHNKRTKDKNKCVRARDKELSALVRERDQRAPQHWPVTHTYVFVHQSKLSTVTGSRSTRNWVWRTTLQDAPLRRANTYSTEWDSVRHQEKNGWEIQRQRQSESDVARRKKRGLVPCGNHHLLSDKHCSIREECQRCSRDKILHCCTCPWYACQWQNYQTVQWSYHSESHSEHRCWPRCDANLWKRLQNSTSASPCLRMQNVWVLQATPTNRRIQQCQIAGV